MDQPAGTPALEDILQKRFGFPAFRPGQREAIEELLSGGRLLCIQPTGHGKSLLYQLPTVLLPGMTLVISPLLALMRDQLGHLKNRFDLPAASINSDQDEAENQQAREQARSGHIRLLFVAPEQLDHVDRFEFLLGLPISLLVVDEAHCISTWGHDFRPSYRQIVNMVRALVARHPALRVLGLTATANARTEADIVAQLSGEGQVAVHRHGMDRPNLRLAVFPVTGMPRKLAYLRKQVARLDGGGLLYCATRENTEIVAGSLAAQGVNAVAYHAGMEPARKRQLQEDFIAGRYQAIAATNALGMGIDKADLRYVIHVDLPGSLVAYYQEVGRAGRDGKPALGLLLFDPADQRIHDHFIRSAQPTLSDFQQVMDAVADLLAQGADRPGLMAIKSRSGLHPTLVTVIIAELIEQGFLVRQSLGGKQVYHRTDRSGQPDLSRYQMQHQIRTRELRHMRDYGLTLTGCLMATLRQDLGDTDAPACGRCSVCRGRPSSVTLDAGEVDAAAHWLEGRPVVIAATQRPRMAEGLALLSGEMRTPAFCEFMKKRANAPAALSPSLVALLRAHLGGLKARFTPGSVVAIPSRTWAQRQETAALVAEVLGIPALLDLLTWQEVPAARQGELRNNDQRRDNVERKMTHLPGAPPPPAGAVLLLDDYVGSGATLKEAVRVLRKDLGVEDEIVPLAIARVRWRQGTTGMI